MSDLGAIKNFVQLTPRVGTAGQPTPEQFAEIAAATVLAGELSMAAAVASGEFVAAHEAYGRNRPPREPTQPV